MTPTICRICIFRKCEQSHYDNTYLFVLIAKQTHLITDKCLWDEIENKPLAIYENL